MTYFSVIHTVNGEPVTDAALREILQECAVSLTDDELFDLGELVFNVSTGAAQPERSDDDDPLPLSWEELLDAKLDELVNKVVDPS